MVSMEGPVRSDQPHPIDITETFSVISRDLALIYLFVAASLYYIARVIKLYSRKRRKRHMNLKVWSFICILLQQSYRTPRYFIIKYILVLFIITIAVLTVFYKNLFATELVAVEHGYIINTLEQLAESTTYPCMPKQSSSIAFFKTHNKAIYRTIHAKYFNALPKSEYRSDLPDFPKTLLSVKVRQCTLMSEALRIKPLMMIYCNLLSNDETPKFHIAEQVFNRSPVTFIVNRNVSEKLQNIFARAHQKGIENGVMEIMLMADSVERLADTLGLSVSTSILTCMSGGVKQEQIVNALQLVNVRYLYAVAFGSLVVALFMLIIELILGTSFLKLLCNITRRCNKAMQRKKKSKRQKKRKAKLIRSALIGIFL